MVPKKAGMASSWETCLQTGGVKYALRTDPSSRAVFLGKTGKNRLDKSIFHQNKWNQSKKMMRHLFYKLELSL